MNSSILVSTALDGLLVLRALLNVAVYQNSVSPSQTLVPLLQATKDRWAWASPGNTPSMTRYIGSKYESS